MMLRVCVLCLSALVLVSDVAVAKWFGRSRSYTTYTTSGTGCSTCVSGNCAISANDSTAVSDSITASDLCSFDIAYAAYRTKCGLFPLIRHPILDTDCETQGVPYYRNRGTHQPHYQRNNPCLENACMGADSPEDALRMWINSSGHRSTLLRNAKYYGIARHGSYYVMRVADIGWEPESKK